VILLKDSTVEYQGLALEMYYALGVAAGLKARMFGVNLVITSLLDGVHNPGSLHPKGLAADLRAKDLSDRDAISWFEEVKSQLEPMGFDVVWEGGVGATPATTGSHIHLEFDPKGRTFWHNA